MSVVHSIWSAYWPETVVVEKGILWDTKDEVLRFHFAFFLLRIVWAIPLSLLVGGVIGYFIGNGLSASASTYEQ